MAFWGCCCSRQLLALLEEVLPFPTGPCLALLRVWMLHSLISLVPMVEHAEPKRHQLHTPAFGYLPPP